MHKKEANAVIRKFSASATLLLMYIYSVQHSQNLWLIGCLALTSLSWFIQGLQVVLIKESTEVSADNKD